MSVMTIDRVDHTNDAEVEAFAGPLATLVAAIDADTPDHGLVTPMSPEQVKEMIRQLGDRGGIFYCREDSDVVAFGRVMPDPQDDTVAIMGVWVRSSHRRRGIGTELARIGAEFIKETGYAKFRGTIPNSNEPALSFFSSVGPIVQLEGGGVGYELPV